ncbi:MAG: hypothetical protein IJP21_01045 [Clostridia bacterium]|nr:hypothetical protein [Clostridia bacterium]
MKKLFPIILVVILLIMPFSFTTFAEAPEVIISETTEYFEDGSSVTTTITQQINKVSRAVTTVSGSKVKTGRNSNGQIEYKFQVNGTFSVNVGISATCTAVSCGASELANGWSLDSSTTSKSGNTASATGILKYKVLFVTTHTIEIPLSLSCDANGTLS